MEAKQTGPRTRIIFVDDEPQVLQILRLGLRSMEPEWEMMFVLSGDEALDQMEAQPFDIIVSDMRMPGMNGAELLTTVMDYYPQTLRIILSGFADEDLVMKCVGATHQYMVKPFSLMEFRNILKQLRTLQNHIQNQEIKALIGKMSSVPSVPTVYMRMMEALKQLDSPIQRVADIVSSDPGLTAQLLHLVNSAFFGLPQSVSNPVQAVQMLGVGRVRSLALSLKLFSSFEKITCQEIKVDQIWNHSLFTAMVARRIMEMESDDFIKAEEAFTAGLLHDIGKLILAANLPKDYRKVLDLAHSQKQPLEAVERDVLKATHAEVGAFLLGAWGLPASLLEAVCFHHHPSQAKAKKINALTAVHIANGLVHQCIGTPLEKQTAHWDDAYLQELGLVNRLADYKSRIDLLHT
jgi:putative nucleotidyltransferase with HDIG domain